MIANIRQIANDAQNVMYPQLMDRLAASVSRPQSQPVTSSVPDDATEPPVAVSAVPAKRTVHINSIPRPRTKTMLETETDIDAFLDAYRNELVAALEQGERILL